MSIRYDMVEKPFGEKNGELYPQEVPCGTISAQQFAAAVASGTTFSAGEVEGMLQQVCSTMLRLLGQGWHVQVGDLGYFSPRLEAVKDVTERSAIHSPSVSAASVNFRPSAKLKREVGTLPIRRVETEHRRRKSAPRNDTFQTEAVKRYLETHTFITVAAYTDITGRLKTAACADLRRMAAQGQVVPCGSGSHRVYLPVVTDAL